jgi:hypothetical protein
MAKTSVFMAGRANEQYLQWDMITGYIDWIE